VNHTADNDDGIRTGETVDGVAREFLIDARNHTGYAQVLQVETDGVVTRTFQLGHDVVAEHVVEPADITTIGHLADGHGSTRLLVDAAGTTKTIYAYTAYGVELDVDAVVLADPALWSTDLRFSGEWTDVKTTGLQYLRERYYDCAAGRFLIVDPYEGSRWRPHSLHKYLYCHGDPVNSIDPSGMLVGALAGAAFRAGEYAMAAGQALRALGIATFVAGAANYAAGATTMAIMKAANSFDPATLRYAMEAESIGKAMMVAGATMCAGGYALTFAGIMAKSAAVSLAIAGSSHNPSAGSAVIGRYGGVPGRYPGYVQLAKDRQANYFNVPTQVWHNLSRAQQKAANFSFLDKAVTKRYVFELSTPRGKIPMNTALYDEVEYLMRCGYTWFGDYLLIPGGGR